MKLAQCEKETVGNAVRVVLFGMLCVIPSLKFELATSLLLMGVPMAKLLTVATLIEVGVWLLVISFGLQILPKILAGLFPLSPAAAQVRATQSR